MTDKYKSKNEFLRSLIARFYQEGKFYKIPLGRLRGMKLIYRDDMSFHAMLGVWEKSSIDALISLISVFGFNNKRVVIADVGANIGYYSMFFSKYLHPDSKIFAFEPWLPTFNTLSKNIYGNKLTNVTLSQLACSDKSGETVFYVGAHHHQSSLLGEWANLEQIGQKITVGCTTLDNFFQERNGGEYPDLIKMDIEGGGVYALKGCRECLLAKRPFILIESHTAAEDGAIIEVLSQYNYEAYRVDTQKWIAHKTSNYQDNEGIWGTMLLVPSELKNKFKALNR